MQKIFFLKLCIIVLSITTVLPALLFLPQVFNLMGGPSILIVMQGGFYLSLLPILIGLLNAWIMLKSINDGDVFSKPVIKSLRIIKYCGLSVSFINVGILLMLVLNGSVDMASMLQGGEMALKSLVFALFASIFQELIQRAHEVQSENDLTI